jgi:sialate O-acetylesterase
MEFEIAKLVNGNQEIVSANFDKIRHITIPYAEGPELKSNFPVIHQWSSWSSRHFKKGEWEVCTPESVRLLSGIGYIFARRLHMATGVPIGIIDASRGGTTVETWTPMNVLEKIDTEEVKALLETWDTKIADFDPKQDLEDRIKKHHEWIERQTKAGKDVSNKQAPTEERVGPAGDPNRPGNCYAGILAPLRGLPVKGAIWHQGYNNALGSETAAPIRYHQIFSQMIPAWRDTFGDPDMPFGIISLCTGGEPQDENDYLERMLDNGVAIRAVQYQTFLDFQKEGDEHIGFASSYDQRRSWYHPQIKIPVGERIARWALATEYDLAKELKWEPTRVEEVIPEPGRLLLKLTGQVIAFNDGPLKGFAVAGDDKKFQPATAEYLVTGKDARGRDQTDRKVIVLTSPLVENPTHYRFAWARNPLANVANSDGTDTPMATQRSDTWSLADLYEAYTGNKTEVSGELSRSERGQLAKALKEADLQRRLHAAKTLLEEHADTLNTN